MWIDVAKASESIDGERIPKLAVVDSTRQTTHQNPARLTGQVDHRLCGTSRARIPLVAT